MNKIWRNETDWWAAESREHARRKYMQFYGYVGDGLDSKVDESILEAVDSFEEEPLPDEKVLNVVFQEGFQYIDEAGASHDVDYPPWVDRVIAAGEQNVKVEKVKLGQRHVYRVTAPALIWATYMDGMVCSTEF